MIERSVMCLSEASERFTGRIELATMPKKSPDLVQVKQRVRHVHRRKNVREQSLSYLAPDQLKYLEAIVPQDESRTSAVVLARNKRTMVVGKATLLNMSLLTSMMLSK